MGPFLFEDGNEDEVEFIQEGALTLEALFRARCLNDEIDNEVANALIFWLVSLGETMCRVSRTLTLLPW